MSPLSVLRESLWLEWMNRSGPPPPVLYHYTSLAGAAGIMTSGVFHATSTYNLNDRTELQYGAELLAHLFPSRRNRCLDTDERILLGASDRDHRFLHPFSLDYFVASFTSAADSLSQWQAYGDAGCGVALGFDSDALRSMSRACIAQSPFILSRVLYDAYKQADWYEYLLDNVCRTAADILREKRRQEILSRPVVEGLQLYVDVSVREYLPSMKSHHFAAEREWRLSAARVSPDPTVLVADASRRRFVKINVCREGLLPLPLVQIVLGPAYYRRERAAKIHEHIVACGYEVPIVQSEVPLRVNREVAWPSERSGTSLTK